LRLQHNRIARELLNDGEQAGVEEADLEEHEERQPDTSKSKVLYQSSNPISIQYDSRLIKIVKKKRELFLGQ
jgi:hypothetical protein